MNFTISKSELLTRLQATSKIISSKPIHPIMSCFLFEVDGGQLLISAADASGRIQASVDCESDGNIKICIEHKMLLDSLKELPEQLVKFMIDNLNITITYAGGKFNMVGKENILFPEPKGIKSPIQITLDGACLLEGLDKTLFCAANDELRPVMNSVYIEPSKDGINYVATTGHILALLSHKNNPISCNPFVLPTKTASILRSIMPSGESVNITVGLNNVVFDFGAYQMMSIYQEGKYPNYRSVIPTSNDKKAKVETYALKGALSRVGIFANQASKLIALHLRSNKLTVTAQDFDYSTNAEETIVCDYAGPDFRIGFNGSLLSEIISHIGCLECELSFSEPNRAALIRPVSDDGALTYLQMPISIN